MEQIFITNLTIDKIRHLKDISIPLSENQIKHLILTGRNGSGKTSVVEALAEYLDNVYTDENFTLREKQLTNAVEKREFVKCSSIIDNGVVLKLEREIGQLEKELKQSRRGLKLRFNKNIDDIFVLKETYHYVWVYYSADREFSAIQPIHVEKVELKDDYGLTEYPRNEFVKYLLDLKVTEALARNNKKQEKADEIKQWFEALEQLLKKIFADETVKLSFDEETFQFHILQEGKEPFDFNTLSSGYQAVMDIVLDIIMRMQNQTCHSFAFHIPGIVIIDEIDAHLHLELQKNIMPLLTAIFPNIQFIVTTHSPFILNSIENAVIYDFGKSFIG